MNNITDKISYTARAIDDIQAALEERGIDMSDIALMLYGNVIRSIKTDENYIDEEGFAHSPIKILDHIICPNFPSFNIVGNIRLADTILTRNETSFTQDYNKIIIEHEIKQPVTTTNQNEIKTELVMSPSYVINTEAVIFQDSDLIIQKGE